MSALDFLKKANDNEKPFRSFGELKVGEAYPILHFRRVTDKKIGTRLRIEIEDFLITMPERFVKGLTDELLEEMNSNRYRLLYKGKDSTRFNRIMVDFEKIE